MIKDLDSTALEAFFEAIPIRMTILDANNNIQAMNTEAWSRVKVNVEERVGNSILDCHSPESASNVMKVIEDLKSGREKVVKRIFQLKDRDKAYQELYTPIRDKKGNFIRDSSSHVRHILRVPFSKSYLPLKRGSLFSRKELIPS